MILSHEKRILRQKGTKCNSCFGLVLNSRPKPRELFMFSKQREYMEDPLVKYHGNFLPSSFKNKLFWHLYFKDTLFHDKRNLL